MAENRSVADELMASRFHSLPVGAVVPYREVLELVNSIHGRADDLCNGDLLHRLGRFDAFVLTDLPLERIEMDEFHCDVRTAEEFTARLRAGEKPPPIVFDGVTDSMIDGMHRSNASSLAGRKTIRALVGTAQHLDPHWYPAGDEDD